MSDFDYAVTNLRTLASNINSYASYAGQEIADTYGEFYDRTKKAEKAVLALVRWMEKNRKE